MEGRLPTVRAAVAMSWRSDRMCCAWRYWKYNAAIIPARTTTTMPRTSPMYDSVQKDVRYCLVILDTVVRFAAGLVNVLVRFGIGMSKQK